MEQRSDEWFEIRRGKFTASEIHRLMSARGLGKTGEAYILECVTESFGGIIPTIHSIPMEHGTVTEPFAISHLEKVLNCTVDPQPFFIAEWCDQAGCSPDGIIAGKNIGIEIKCPYDPTNHIKHMMISSQQELKEQKPEYYWQIMMCLAVTDCESWRFISYHDDFSGMLRMYIMPVYPDEADIRILKERVLEAVRMKNMIIESIKERLNITQ